jgi:glycine betaine/proline transport system ATP-binding protein
LTTTPAITAEDLWQVFGPDPLTAFRRAQSDASSPEDIARVLDASGHIPAVRGVSFDVAPGELFVIMGLSGSGKSTVVRGLSRLLQPTSGAVRLYGEDILAASKSRMNALRRNKIGMVFQHFGLFPHMTVIDNVAYPLKVARVSQKERYARVRPVLEMLGLQGRDTAYPRELSGGQRQRVGIARSLAGDCSIWFLDEPFSALDPLIRRQLQDEFLTIRKRLNTTIVFITHDITEALKLADRIAIMRDGQIVQIGTPAEIVLNPVDDYVRDFARDVARGRHARVGSIMRNDLRDIPGDTPGLNPDMTLEDALAFCVERYDPVPVRDPAGQVLGHVYPHDLAKALQAEKA